MADPWGEFADAPAARPDKRDPWAEFDDHPAAGQTGAGGAFVRGAVRSVLPAAGGVAAFAPGAAAGGIAIAPLAALSGPAAPFVEGLGAVGGGVASSLGAGYLVDKGQNWILDRLPDGVRSALGQDAPTMAADRAQHPRAAFAGELIPQAAFMRPGFMGKVPALIGASIGGATETGRELADGNGVDPVKIAMATGAGALLQRPTRLGRALGVPTELPKAADRAPQAEAPADPDVIRFKDAADLANFRSTVHADKAGLSDAEFLDWFGKSRSTPAVAVVGEGVPAVMDQEGMQPATTSGPVDEWAQFADAPGPSGRALDRIDIPPPARPSPAVGDPWSEFADLPTKGTARPMMERASPEQIADIARGTDPGSVLPIPRNEVESLDEAMKANPGPRQLVKAPYERQALPSYSVNGLRRKDPLDLVGWLRTQGGIRDEGGKIVDGERVGTLMQRLGVGNEPRDLEFTKSERMLGKLVREDGMNLDDAALKAWEAGYFPEHVERPTINEFLDALEATHKGGSGRVYHPDDYEAIDAYRAAQRARNDIERAADEGRPVVADVGQPATLADLDANQPPATAYEDLPRIGGTVGNIRVGKLSSKQDIARALQTVDNRFGGFDAARRGKIAQAETEALASELNMTPDVLLKRRRGQALNAEQALAARAILAKSGDELVNLAKAARGGSDEALAAFRSGLVRHAAIQEQVAGATAEAGRALAQFRMDASGKLARGRMLQAIVDSGGGRGKLEDVAQKIIDLEGDPAKANEFARKVMKPGGLAMAKEYWVNALLSGPRTHATNIGSNLLTALWSIPEHAVTATIGKITRSSDRMTYRDVGARTIGMIEGAKDGLRLARKAFMTGEPTDGVSQVEAQNYRAIPGKLGSAIRTPTRALMAEDEFFKSIAYRGELHALAARAAYRSGGTAEQRARTFEQLRDNPTDNMIDHAVKAARYQTFQAALKGPGIQIQMLANKGPMKLFLPFVRTPLNLLKYATERSPLAPVLSEFRDAMRAGGMARDQAVARVTMGSGLAALAVSWAIDGKLSGSGPADPREREALRNTGWQPFSIKVGDRWFSYQRIDPFARVLSTAADFATFGDYMSADERENLAKYLSLAIARNISTMPTLDPAASAFEALSDPDRYLTRYATNLGASMVVPNVVTQINSTLDPYMRETDGLLDTIKSRVPGQSNKLPARTNIWGAPIERGDALGPDLLSPIYSSRMKGDKTLSEVARLRLGLSKPQRKIGDARLSPKQYADMVKGAGQPAKQMLDRITANSQWNGLPDGTRRLVIQQVVGDLRKQAKLRALLSNRDLLRAEITARVKRKTGER